MREIESKPWYQGSMFKPSAAICPRCQAPMVNGPVRCPDGMEGCCVAHYGLICTECRRQFQ